MPASPGTAAVAIFIYRSYNVRQTFPEATFRCFIDRSDKIDGSIVSNQIDSNFTKHIREECESGAGLIQNSSKHFSSGYTL